MQEDTTTRFPNPHAKIALQEHPCTSQQHSSAPIAGQECGVTATAPHFVKTVVSDSTQNLSQHRRALHALMTDLAQQLVPVTPATVQNAHLLENVKMGSARLDTRQTVDALPVFLANTMETTVVNALAKRLPFFSTEHSSCLVCTCSSVCCT